jgi:hypothetical protein
MQKPIWILLILIYFSCENLFHEEDNEYLLIDNQQEKIDLLNGIYSNLIKVHDANYLFVLTRSDDINVYQNYSFYYPDQSGLVGCSTGGSSSIDFAGLTDPIYMNLYLAILSSNHLIKQLEEETDPAIVGEAYFLRAYCYLKLARLFGKVPLVTDIDVNYMLEKPSYAEVYELIESDLIKALELLPETYTFARIPGETPHKGTAKALLAEVYLSMAGFPVNDNAKYAEAARLAGEVIEQSRYYGFALLDDMANLWKTAYRHNTENIFGLFYSGGSEELNNYFGGNYVNIYSDIQFEIGGIYNPKFKFFNDFPNNYRKQVSVVTGKYEQIYYDTLGGHEHSTFFRTFDPLYNACYFIEGAFLLKWIDVEALNTWRIPLGRPTNINPLSITLCSDFAYLCRSKSQAGNLDESCYEAINKVRRRANKLDIIPHRNLTCHQDYPMSSFLILLYGKEHGNFSGSLMDDGLILSG